MPTAPLTSTKMSIQLRCMARDRSKALCDRAKSSAERPKRGLPASAIGDKRRMAETARRAFIATLVAVSVIALALALWKLRSIVGLLFLAFTISAAMRPGVDALHRHRVPRALGVLLHYVVLAGIIAVLLWLVVPRALQQIDAAVRNVPTTRAAIGQAASHSKGIKHEVLIGIQHRLQRLPRASELVKPAVHLTVKAFEVIVAIFFVFAAAAYWIFERDKLIDYVT